MRRLDANRAEKSAAQNMRRTCGVQRSKYCSKWSYTRMQSSTTISTGSIFFLNWCAACLPASAHQSGFQFQFMVHSLKVMFLFDKRLLDLDQNKLHVFVHSKIGCMIKIVQCELLSRPSHTSVNITLLHNDHLLSVQFHRLWHVA